MLTAEDIARWPEETRVLMDICLERGGRVKVWSKTAINRARRKHYGSVRPYHVVHPDFGDLAWRPSGEPSPAIWDSLHGLEDFNLKQETFPVATPTPQIVAERMLAGDTVWLNGVRFEAPATPQGRLAMVDELIAAGLVATMNDTRAVLAGRRSGKTATMARAIEIVRSASARPVTQSPAPRRPRRRP